MSPSKVPSKSFRQYLRKSDLITSKRSFKSSKNLGHLPSTLLRTSQPTGNSCTKVFLCIITTFLRHNHPKPSLFIPMAWTVIVDPQDIMLQFWPTRTQNSISTLLIKWTSDNLKGHTEDKSDPSLTLSGKSSHSLISSVINSSPSPRFISQAAATEELSALKWA